MPIMYPKNRVILLLIVLWYNFIQKVIAPPIHLKAFSKYFKIVSTAILISK